MRKPSATSLILFGFSLGILGSTHASTLGSAVFSDVGGNDFFDSAVGEMYAEGIITGYQNGRFGPNDFVTRGQVAVMLQRFRKSLLGESLSSSSRSRSSSSSSSSSDASSSSSSSSSASFATATPQGLFRFTTGSYKGEEDQAKVLVNIIRYGGNEGQVTVEYMTENGTATSGSDYDATSGTLTFAAGKTTAMFEVPLKNDNEAEGNESIVLKLTNPGGGAQLGGPIQATITIVDDDALGSGGQTTDQTNSKGVFVFSASKYEIAENMSTVTIAVERKTGSDGEASITYKTSNGTATGENYAPTNGTLTFSSGETSKTFTIAITNNSAVNGNKTVNLTLSAPTGGATLGSLSSSSLVIVDDEITTFTNGKFKLEEAEYSVNEGGTVFIKINRLAGSKGEVQLTMATQDVLAKAGDDFTNTSGTLTFKEGEAQKIISIPTATDSKDDPRETFKFIISNPTGGATLDTQSSASITIE